jgi:hypothetical protein
MFWIGQTAQLCYDNQALFRAGLAGLFRLVKGILDKRSLDLDILSVMVDMDGSRPHKGKIYRGSELKKLFEKREEAGYDQNSP